MAVDQETLKQLVESVARFVRERLVPLEDQVAREDAVPGEIIAAMGELVAERAALLQFVVAALAQATNALSASEKAKFDQVESSYISIVTDTARNGTPSERKLWRLRFGEQQAIAGRMVEELTRFSKKLNDLSEEINAYIKLITNIT